MKKQLGLLAKLAVMAGLLALLYRKVDFADFRAALAGLQWGWQAGRRVGHVSGQALIQ